MSLESRFLALLRSPAVQALTGPRIYNRELPRNTPAPHLVWQRVSTSPRTTHELRSSLDSLILQVTIFAATAEEAATLRDAVRDTVEGGDGADGLTATTADLTDPERDSATDLYRCDIDFNLWYTISS